MCSSSSCVTHFLCYLKSTGKFFLKHTDGLYFLFCKSMSREPPLFFCHELLRVVVCWMKKERRRSISLVWCHWTGPTIRLAGCRALWCLHTVWWPHWCCCGLGTVCVAGSVCPGWTVGLLKGNQPTMRVIAGFGHLPLIKVTESKYTQFTLILYMQCMVGTETGPTVQLIHKWAFKPAYIQKHWSQSAAVCGTARPLLL